MESRGGCSRLEEIRKERIRERKRNKERNRRRLAFHYLAQKRKGSNINGKKYVYNINLFHNTIPWGEETLPSQQNQKCLYIAMQEIIKRKQERLTYVDEKKENNRKLRTTRTTMKAKFSNSPTRSFLKFLTNHLTQRERKRKRK